jgi:cysteine synthase A
MIMIEDGILSVIGNTPLVRLSRALSSAPFHLYGKLEFLNPGGSVKDRAAIKILKEAMATGAVREGSVVIESSSGNMGIGLAQACSIYNLRFICVVDPKTTTQNILLLKAYGADVEVVEEPDPITGEFLQARIDRVRDLVNATENSFWPNQYANLSNALAHHRTMQEIEEALDGEVDFIFCAISTCGTMRGCAEYIRAHSLPTTLFAVDAVGSVIFGGVKSKRLIPGHGAAVTPALFQPDLADQCVHVSDLDCIVGCRTLVRRESILAGGSSGAVLMAVDKMKHRIPEGSTCVVVLPDRGERYLDTIYSDAWVKNHFGEVSHLWSTPQLVTPVEVEACATAIY